MNIDINMIVAAIVFAFVALALRGKFRHAMIVPEGYVALVYANGKFVEVLQAGRQVRWGRNITFNAQDVRKAVLQIPGQDVLTADNVSVKFSLALIYQIADPVKTAHETQNWHADIYSAAQLALRTVISAAPMETLLAQRNAIDAQLLPIVQPLANAIGISVIAVQVKDIILPGDLKRAFAETLKAKQEGQAALERARGETAALRNLANAARVLDANPALMNLRLVQSITSAQNAGHTLVFGMPAGFVPLKNGKAGAAPNESNEN